MTRILLLAVSATLMCATNARGVFIDLRGVPAPAALTSAGGITLTWSTSRSGVFTSTATRFGFDSTGAGDAPDLIDGGSGAAEDVGFLFSTPVYVDSVVISQFDAGDAGTFQIKTESAIALGNGVNEIGSVIAGSGTAHFIRWTGANAPGVGLGFSIDGFNVRPVAPFSADFDFDADVDGRDLLIWQRNLGLASPPVASPAQGNANFDNRVDRLDLQVWQQQFVNGPAAIASVPEPARLPLFITAVVALMATSRTLSDHCRVRGAGVA